MPCLGVDQTTLEDRIGKSIDSIVPVQYCPNNKSRSRARTYVLAFCMLITKEGGCYWPCAKSTLAITHELEDTIQANDSEGPTRLSAYCHLVGSLFSSLCGTDDANSTRP